MAMNNGIEFDSTYEAKQNTDTENLSKYDEESCDSNKLLVLEDLLSIHKGRSIQHQNKETEITKQRHVI